MHNLALILQIFALICFFISGMNWQIPQTAIHAVGSSQ